MVTKIILALQALAVFAYGLFSIWQVINDKKDDKRAIYLTVASLVFIIIGIMVTFREALFGLVILGIGFIALIISSTMGLKEQSELKNGEVSSGFVEFIFSFFGIICIAVAIAGYEFASFGVLRGFLLVLATISFMWAFMAKTYKIAGYILVVVLILTLLAVSSIFI